jgi:surface polysaccharide O-acyltransferase-like enzyme
MSIESAQQGAVPDAAVLGTRPVPHWSRSLAVATVVIFFVSTAFPVVAGLSKNSGAFPKWWGIADVVLAFVLAAMVLAVMVAANGKINRQAEDATYRAYRVLSHGIFVMLVVFFLAGERITWVNCLTGFAWRAWLLLYALPSWFTVMKAPPEHRQI